MSGEPAGGRAPWRPVLAGVVLVLVGALGVWTSLRADQQTEPPPASSPSPSPPAYALEVELRRVNGLAVVGKARDRRLRDPAESVRQMMTDLYSTAFVDPARWESGRFSTLFPHFVADAREQARRDLENLSLGAAAAHLDAVRPEWARLDVRFLVGPTRRPLAAMASMRFAAIGFGPGVPGVVIRHRAEYLLHLVEGRWLIAGYEVEGSVGGAR
jgi:hypothetical protein